MKSIVEVATNVLQNKQPSISMTMPLFIRLLEWAKEECKDDVEIHQVAEKISKLSLAQMTDYEKIVK